MKLKVNTDDKLLNNRWNYISTRVAMLARIVRHNVEIDNQQLQDFKYEYSNLCKDLYVLYRDTLDSIVDL
jgi:hypothetical protein